MKHTANHLKRIGAIGLLAVVVGMTGCKSSGDRSLTQKWGDHDVAKAVKKELSKDPMFKYEDVQAVVYEGTVQLTGFVDTPEQRQRAAELASHAQGVRQIVNSIEIKPTPTGRPQPNAPASSQTQPSPPAPGAVQEPTQGTGAGELKSNP